MCDYCFATHQQVTPIPSLDNSPAAPHPVCFAWLVPLLPATQRNRVENGEQHAHNDHQLAEAIVPIVRLLSNGGMGCPALPVPPVGAFAVRLLSICVRGGSCLNRSVGADVDGRGERKPG